MSEGPDYDGDNRPEGRYSNYFMVGHNAFEVVLDFGQRYSDEEEARIHTRIVSGPPYAKALSKLLQETVDQYEAAYGVIPDETENNDGN